MLRGSTLKTTVKKAAPKDSILGKETISETQNSFGNCQLRALAKKASLPPTEPRATQALKLSLEVNRAESGVLIFIGG